MAALVSVAAGEGVMTKNVGVLSAGVDVCVGEIAAGSVALTAAEAGGGVLGSEVGFGTAVWRPGRFRNSRMAATPTAKRPPTSDQRARTTYRCLTR